MWGGSLVFYSPFLGNFCSEPPHFSTLGPSGIDLECCPSLLKIKSLIGQWVVAQGHGQQVFLLKPLWSSGDSWPPLEHSSHLHKMGVQYNIV